MTNKQKLWRYLDNLEETREKFGLSGLTKDDLDTLRKLIQDSLEDERTDGYSDGYDASAFDRYD